MNESEQIIGQRYKVFGQSAGGMGVVFFCEDMDSGGKIVLKTLKDEHLREKTVQRFTDEARIWLRLGYHPNIVWARGVERFAGRPYIILEFAGGYNLRNWMKIRPLDVKHFAKIVGSVCTAMDYAAWKIPSIAHCDLKPENIVIRVRRDVRVDVNHLAEHLSETVKKKQREVDTMLNSDVDFWDRQAAEDTVLDALASEQGRSRQEDITAVKVTDFGLAKAVWDMGSDAEGIGDTHEQVRGLLAVGGTLPYISPEQCLGRRVDIRSDIYSFGIVLYEMLTDRLPYSARDRAHWVRCHIQQPPEKMTIRIDGVPQGVADVVLKCLEKSPEARHQSFQELIDDLQEAFSGTPFLFKTFEEERVGEQRYIVDKESGALVLHSGIFLTEAEELAESGLALIQMGRSEEGLLDLQKATSTGADNVGMMERIVTKLESMGQLDLALQLCEQGLAKNPDCRKLRYVKSTVMATMGRATEAISLIDDLIQEDPNDAAIWTDKGAILCNYMNNLEGAVGCFDKGLEIDDEFSMAWANRGTALSRLGRIEDALDSFERALEIDSDNPDVHVGVGSILQDCLGRSEEALEHFDTAVKLDRSHSMAWHGRGVALEALGMIGEAFLSYEQAIGVDDENTYALWNLGGLLARSGKYSKAAKLFEKVVNLEPDNKEARLCWAECRKLGAQ